MIAASYKSATFYWTASLLLAAFISLFALDVNAVTADAGFNAIIRFVTPLVVCIVLSSAAYHFQSVWLPYCFFFTISFTSVIGLTNTLTGSHAESSNVLLFGLSFYTASLAYLCRHGVAHQALPFQISNPLLLLSGPVLTFTRSIAYKSLSSRWRYYFPFLVLGLFLHQAIATPLTQTFSLLDKTDLVSSLLFATIFELFVYANFCGLSLMAYAICGIIGFVIPLNFRQPFSSTNIVDFWKGWHTSLSQVLKALFYQPARQAWGSTAALFCVYVASAMWHGVTLNFLLWGVFHASMFVLTLWLLRKKINYVPLVLFVIAVVVGRLLFSDSDTGRLISKLSFRFDGLSFFGELAALGNHVKFSLALICVFVMCEFFFQKTVYFRKRNYKFFRLPAVQFVLLLVTLGTIDSNVGINYAVYGQR